MGTHTPDTTTTTKVNKTGAQGREGESENENTANEVISNFLFYFSAMRANYCRCCFVFFFSLDLLLRLLLRWPVLCDDCLGIGQNVACDDNTLVQLGH